MIQFKIIPGNRERDTKAYMPSDSIWGCYLASTEKTLSVPAGADFAVIRANDDVVLRYDATASEYGTTFAQNGELILANTEYVRCVTEVSTLHFIKTINDCDISVAFYGK